MISRDSTCIFVLGTVLWGIAHVVSEVFKVRRRCPDRLWTYAPLTPYFEEKHVVLCGI